MSAVVSPQPRPASMPGSVTGEVVKLTAELEAVRRENLALRAALRRQLGRVRDLHKVIGDVGAWLGELEDAT